VFCFAEYRTLRDERTFVGGEPREVRIERMPPLPMIDDDKIAVAAQRTLAVHAPSGERAHFILAQLDCYPIRFIFPIVRIALNNRARLSKIGKIGRFGIVNPVECRQ